MQRPVAFVIFISIATGCGLAESSNTQSKQAKHPTIKFVIKVDSGDFRIIERGDSTIYVRQLFEGLDDRDIQFNEKLVKSINVKMKVAFGVLQYTVDDDPAFPLTFVYESPWCNLTVNNNAIGIPAFYPSGNSKNIAEILGFKNNQDLISFIEDKNIEEIKHESIKVQTNFYSALLKDQNYLDCCPEYVAQAEKFLKSKKDTLNNFRNLAVELITD